MQRFDLTTPGLFVTGTDTAVGKTLITAAICRALCERGWRVGAFKPVASGCQRRGDALVNEDAAALHASIGGGFDAQLVCPVRYEPAVAPAVAAEMTGRPLDWSAVRHAIAQLDREADRLVVEGVGGLLAPLDGDLTVLDLIVAMALPVVVVCRANLGTLNHTAMTVRLLRDAGCRVVGLIMNGDDSQRPGVADDSLPTNRAWLERMCGAPVLAQTPRCEAEQIDLGSGRIPQVVRDAIARVHWDVVIGESD